MLGYFCKPCQLYFRELDLLSNKRCPECRGKVEPRLILCGQVMGADEQPAISENLLKTHANLIDILNP